MNLDTMQTILTRCLAGRASGLEPAELQRALNFVYQVQLPNRIDGPFRTGTSRLALQSGKSRYLFSDFDDPLIRTVEKGASYEGEVRELVYYDRESDFLQRFPFQAQSISRPVAYLVEYEAVTLRPEPDPNLAAAIIFPVTFYREPLTANGVADEEEAHAVVYGAAVHLAAQNHWDALIQLNNSLYENSARALTERSRGKMRRAPIRRDF